MTPTTLKTSAQATSYWHRHWKETERHHESEQRKVKKMKEDDEGSPEGPEPPSPDRMAEEGEGDGFIDVQGIIPRLKLAILLKHNCALRGRTGTGKTFLIRKLAEEQERKLITLNMTVNTSIDEIKGRYVLVPGEKTGLTAKWVDGALVRAMKEGHWVVIEEANFMRDEVASVLYSPMDDRRELVIDEHEGETIIAHEDFRIFLTMNWDYAGTQRFNPAIMNRINSWFDVDYLPQTMEAKLLVKRAGIDKDIANQMCMFARKVRAAAAKESLPDLSTRILLNWAQVIKQGMEPVAAAEMSVIPILGYTEDEKAMPRELLEAIFGVKEYEDD